MTQMNTDRILVLEPTEGFDEKNAKSLTNVHVIMEPSTCFWYFKYDKGDVPGALKQKFTTFNLAKSHAENYYKKRGIKVTRVED